MQLAAWTNCVDRAFRSDVDDRLARLRIALPCLGVRQRVLLPHPVQIRPGQFVGFALVEVGTPADVAVGRANTDSNCASTSRSRLVACTLHGSTEKHGC